MNLARKVIIRACWSLVAMLLVGGCVLFEMKAAFAEDGKVPQFYRKAVLTAPQPKFSYISGIAISPDQSLIAAGNGGLGLITIWNAQTGNVMRQIKVVNLLGTIAFTRDGRYLITEPSKRSDAGNRILASVFDVETGALVTDLHWPPDIKAASIEKISVSLKDDRVAVATCGGGVLVYSSLTWQLTEAWPFPREYGCMTALTHSPDGEKMLVGTSQGFLIVVEILGRRVLTTIRAYPQRISGISFSPNGGEFAVSSLSSNLQAPTDVGSLWSFYSLTRTSSFVYNTPVILNDVSVSDDYVVFADKNPPVFSNNKNMKYLLHIDESEMVRSVKMLGSCFVMSAVDHVSVWCSRDGVK